MIIQNIMPFGILSILSISNNMSGLSQNNEVLDNNETVQFSKRRRVPSQYAECIRQLTKSNRKIQPKFKKIETVDQQSYQTHQSISNNPIKLSCVLPSGNRKLSLSIIIKKKEKCLPVTPCVSRQNIASRLNRPSPVVSQHRKIQAETQPKNENLLDALFRLCQQHKNRCQIQQNGMSKSSQYRNFNKNGAMEGESYTNSKQNYNGSGESRQGQKERQRSRKQKGDQEKYLKMYSKYRHLQSKMDEIQFETWVL